MAAFGSTNATPLLEGSDSENEDSTAVQSETFIDDKPLFKAPEPKDKYSMAFLIFYFIGMTTLLPWNFFITADDVSERFWFFIIRFILFSFQYWMYKFRDVNKTGNATKRTSLQAEFTSYVNVASTVPTVVFLFINAIITQKYVISDTVLLSYSFIVYFRIPVHTRMVGSLVLMLFLFILTTAFVNINTDHCK